MRTTVSIVALVATVGCHPAGPSDITVTSIRYQRVYPVTGDSGQRMEIDVSLPAQKRIPFCFPTQMDVSNFVCSSPNMSLDAGDEALIWVYHPAIGRQQVATTLFVNGYQVTRITTTAGGLETGSVHLTASGGIE